MIIGGIMAASLTGMCALFASVHPLMSASHGEGDIAWRTRFVFLGTGLCGVTVIALTAFSDPSLPTAAAILLPSCILVGVIAAGLVRPSRSSAGRAIVILNLAFWMIIAALVSAIFTIQLYAILRFRVEGASTLMLAGAVALLPHCYCLVGPRYRYLGFMAVIVAWLLLFVAPGHRVVFLLALHLLGQGGGVAAGPIVSPSSSKVCNLGTFDRPVLYFSAEGCTRNVALRHLKEVSMIRDPNLLGKLVGCWRTTVKRRQEGCVVSRRP